MLKLMARSLQLDVQMMLLPMPSLQKLEFIAKKYWLLLRNKLFGFVPGQSYINIFGGRYHYDDEYGIAFLQSVYVDHYDLTRYIKPNGVVIDIGANIGQFNFFARNVLRAKSVYSFEPIKETFALLERNSPGNNFNLAISTAQGEQKFYVPETSLMASSCLPSEAFKEVSVRCCELDAVVDIRQHQSIQLLKIDTEGSELDVVKSAGNIIKRAEYLLIEASVSRPSGGDISELLEYFSSSFPDFKLIWFGRKFDSDNGVTLAVDCLFRNASSLSLVR